MYDGKTLFAQVMDFCELGDKAIVEGLFHALMGLELP